MGHALMVGQYGAYMPDSQLISSQGVHCSSGSARSKMGNTAALYVSSGEQSEEQQRAVYQSSSQHWSKRSMYSAVYQYGSQQRAHCMRADLEHCRWYPHIFSTEDVHCARRVDEVCEWSAAHLDTNQLGSVRRSSSEGIERLEIEHWKFLP